MKHCPMIVKTYCPTCPHNINGKCLYQIEREENMLIECACSDPDCEIAIRVDGEHLWLIPEPNGGSVRPMYLDEESRWKLIKALVEVSNVRK